MVLVASLLLPLVAVLLFAMDRVEDWVGSASPPGERGGAGRRPLRRRARHLRLVRDEEPGEEEPGVETVDTGAADASATDATSAARTGAGAAADSARGPRFGSVGEREPETVRDRRAA